MPGQPGPAGADGKPVSTTEFTMQTYSTSLATRVTMEKIIRGSTLSFDHAMRLGFFCKHIRRKMSM